MRVAEVQVSAALTVKPAIILRNRNKFHRLTVSFLQLCCLVSPSHSSSRFFTQTVYNVLFYSALHLMQCNPAVRTTPAVPVRLQLALFRLDDYS